VVITAIVRNGTLYYSDAATPYGPYPYPLEMRFGPRSIVKSIGVPLALLRLAEVYGPFVLNLKIADYVQVADPKYRRIRFIDAADMSTGMGGAGSLKTNPNDTEDGYVDPHYDEWYLAPSKADKLREIDAHNAPYPWEPGTVMRYRDQDFYLLGAALEGFLKSVRGTDADIWDMLRTEVLAPIGIHHAPIVRTREPGGKPGLAWFCAGYYPTLDDLAKIATLYEDGGTHGGRPILDRKLTAAIFSTENTIRQNTDMAVDRRLPPEDDDRELLYKMGFHYFPYVGERTGKRIYLPTMRGSTGNIITLYPNHVISMRLTKAWPMPKEDQHTEVPTTLMMRAVDRLAPF
jgi:CubicO group peptidase (beta-lactamase class C family)